jgi:NAD(P)-dependent dehydrogenase (short-subunit alcohol dehydrogenase family)
VEVTENDMIGGGGNPMSQAVKMAQKVLPLLWAAELATHRITVMAVTPGFLRSESMLFGSWELGRDSGLADYDGRRPWGADRERSIRFCPRVHDQRRHKDLCRPLVHCSAAR